MQRAMSCESIVKLVLRIYSHTDIVTMAAYLYVCAAQEEARCTNNALSNILTAMKNLLHAASYGHRDYEVLLQISRQSFISAIKRFTVAIPRLVE